MGKKHGKKGYLTKHKESTKSATIRYTDTGVLQDIDNSKMVLACGNRIYKCKEITMSDFDSYDIGELFPPIPIEYYTSFVKNGKEKIYPYVDISVERFISHANAMKMKFNVQHPEKMIVEYVKNKHLLPIIDLPKRFEEISMLIATLTRIIVLDQDSGLLHSGAIVKELKNSGEYYRCTRKLIKELAIPSGIGVGEGVLTAIADNFSAIKRIISFENTAALEATMDDYSDILFPIINVAGCIESVGNYTEFTDAGITDEVIAALKALDVRTCCMGNITDINMLASTCNKKLKNRNMYYTIQYVDDDLRYPDTDGCIDLQESDWSSPCFIVTNPYAIESLLSQFTKNELLDVFHKATTVNSFIDEECISDPMFSGFRHNYKR